MQITSGTTALVLTDPQNDFLGPTGVRWELVGASLQDDGTVEHIEQLLVAAKQTGTPVFVSPHVPPAGSPCGRTALQRAPSHRLRSRSSRTGSRRQLQSGSVAPSRAGAPGSCTGSGAGQGLRPVHRSHVGGPEGSGRVRIAPCQFSWRACPRWSLCDAVAGPGPGPLDRAPDRSRRALSRATSRPWPGDGTPTNPLGGARAGRPWRPKASGSASQVALHA